MGKPSKEEEALRQLAGEIGAEFLKDESGDTIKVVARVKQWTISLSAVMGYKGTSYSTTKQAMGHAGVAMLAPYVSKDRFEFRVVRKGRFARLWLKLFGTKAIEIGYRAFDHDFVVKGNDESTVRALFANPRIRELIQSLQHVNVEGVQDESTERFAQRVALLVFWFSLGPIELTNVRKLKWLFELFEEILNQLCRIGSASEEEPDAQILAQIIPAGLRELLGP